jgi:O-antigen biosynthesis alpha-1,2-mannosyltransferase
MRIGVMLRHMDQHEGGVKVYTKHLLPRLFEFGNKHEFVLLYQNPQYVGTYSAWSNVREVAIQVPNRFLWDQLAVRYAERRECLDLVFNLKYSLPLFSRIPGVFVCHGLDWYVMPWGSRLADRLSHRLLVPHYARKAAGIIAVSDTTRAHVLQFWAVGSDRVQTIHHGVSSHFLYPVTEELRRHVQDEYQLPECFVLYVGQIYPAKNFRRLLQAYAKVGPELGVPLVVAGGLTDASYKSDLAVIDTLHIQKWVIQAGWVKSEKLPAFYALAQALLLPSLYESFGQPIIEAMAAGCPVVTANRYGTREVAGDAAVLVDPEDIGDIAEGIRRVLSNAQLRSQLRAAGCERAKFFSWNRCARETLAFLERIYCRAAGRVPE